MTKINLRGDESAQKLDTETIYAAARHAGGFWPGANVGESGTWSLFLAIDEEDPDDEGGWMVRMELPDGGLMYMQCQAFVELRQRAGTVDDAVSGLMDFIEFEGAGD